MHGKSLAAGARRPPVVAVPVVAVPVVAVLAVAVLAACGGPAAPASAPPGNPEARTCLDVTGGAPWHGEQRVDGDRVTLDTYDDYFAPSCLVVPAGRPVTLVVTNRGHVPHVLSGLGGAVGGSVDAGQTAFVPLPPLRRAARLVCDLHADEQMVLAVVPTGAGADV
jgi:hypothetical protein